MSCCGNVPGAIVPVDSKTSISVHSEPLFSARPRYVPRVITMSRRLGADAGLLSIPSATAREVRRNVRIAVAGVRVRL